MSTGSANDYDPVTDGWSNPPGVGDAWTCTADGRFTHATLLQQTLYGCTTRYF